MAGSEIGFIPHRQDQVLVVTNVHRMRARGGDQILNALAPPVLKPNRSKRSCMGCAIKHFGIYIPFSLPKNAVFDRFEGNLQFFDQDRLQKPPITGACIDSDGDPRSLACRTDEPLKGKSSMESFLMPPSSLMSGFPAHEADQITLGNWRTAPYIKWSFQHVREIIPSADIPNAPNDVWTLESQPMDFSSFSFDHGGENYSLERLLDASDTDGLVILHRGKVILERYANGMTSRTPHILMSVSKSLTAIVAGILIAGGKLDPQQRLVSIIPELKDSAYADVTTRHVLDMRVGLDWDEDYLATSGPIIEYRKAQNWNPLAPGDRPNDLRNFLSSMKHRTGPDGGSFHYVSTNSDLLGWILERVTGMRFADLMSSLLWQPMGAQHAAYITVDRLGAPRCAGGICTTVSDLAHVGQLLVQNGKRNGKAVIPSAWIEDTLSNGDPSAWAAGDLIAYLGDRPMHYRNKWYVLRDRAIAFGLGVFGQNLFVDRANELVIAKVSSQAPPLDRNLIDLTMTFVEAVSDRLAGR